MTLRLSSRLLNPFVSHLRFNSSFCCTVQMQKSFCGKTSTADVVGSRKMISKINDASLSRTLHSTSYNTSGLFGSIWQRIGFTGRMKYPKYVLRRSSLRLYLCCVELVDHDLFLHQFQMPDTFNSWCRVTELHVWMCMVRLAQEGVEGKFLRNNMLRFMWEDIEKKTKKLGENVASSARRQGIEAISEQFRAILFAYDEGLLSDDKALAGALWRNFFEKDCKDIEHLEVMVEYVRRQLVNLDKMESNILLTSGFMTFTPLYETSEAFERQKQILAQIMKRL